MPVSAVTRLVYILVVTSLVVLYTSVQVSALASTQAAAEDVSREDASLEEDTLLEGDIIIDSEVIPLVELRRGEMVRNLVADPRHLWPARTVYYQLPRDDHQLGAAVEEALAHIMAVSCVRFAPRPPHQKTYLKLRVTGKGCATKVGYHEEDGMLDLHIGGVKCHTRGTIQHEFLHALGFWHEHTRPDRDNHVSVVWDNIKADYKTNFLKRSEKESLNLGLPYDYASVMHYKQTSFAKHKGTPTLVPKNKEAVKVMGQRRGVTWVDIAKLNRLYNCSDEYYRGLDLKQEGAVFGKIIETNAITLSVIRAENSTLDEDTSFQKTAYRSDKHTLEVVPHCNENADCTFVDGPKRDELVTRHTRWTPESFPTDLRGNHHFRRQKRETGGVKPQTIINGEMADRPQQNGRHENFAPQKILPELLKGVLNNDNNERPIVFQFAFYQPVIYRNENQTENSDGGSTDNRSKQSEIANKIISEFVNQKNQNDKQKDAQSSNRDKDGPNRNNNNPGSEQRRPDPDFQGFNSEYGRDSHNSQEFTRNKDIYSSNVQEHNRDFNKYNQNSQGFNSERDYDNSNSQEYDRKNGNYNNKARDSIRDHDQFNVNTQDYSRVRDENNRNSQGYTNGGVADYHSQYGDESYSPKKQYDIIPSGSRGKGTVSTPELITTPNFSDQDHRPSYDTRNEYSSSFQVSKQGGSDTKYRVDNAPSPIQSVKSEITANVNNANLPNQDVVSLQKTDVELSSRMPLKDNYFVGAPNRPFESTMTGADRTATSTRDDIQPPTLQRGDEPILPETKPVALEDTYSSRSDYIVTPIPQIKYPVDTDLRGPALQEGYDPLKKELSNLQTTEVHLPTPFINSQHDTKEPVDLKSSGRIGGDEYHSLESKQGLVEKSDTYNPPEHDSAPVDHYSDSKIGSKPISNMQLTSTFNEGQAKPLIEDIVEPQVSKPLPAKSTEIPLEVGPPKMIQPLVGSGDGENVAPNWKGFIELEGISEEPHHMSVESPENLGNLPHLTRADFSSIKTSDVVNPDMSEIKIETRRNKRPDIATEEDGNYELDKEIRRQKLEKKLQEEAISKKFENPVILVPAKAKPDINPRDAIDQRKTQVITKVPSFTSTPPILPSTPPPPPPPPPSPRPPHPPPKRASNPRREVQPLEEDSEVVDADEDLIYKPIISRVNLNPRQALPLKANATLKLNLRKLFRKERTR